MADIFHRVWSFSGVSPPLIGARFQPPHHRVAASYTYYDFCPVTLHVATKGASARCDREPGRSPRIRCVNCRCTTAAFTLSPEPGASLCCANLPGDWALYAVSVRRLTALHSGFLQTPPRGDALAVG